MNKNHKTSFKDYHYCTYQESYDHNDLYSCMEHRGATIQELEIAGIFRKKYQPWKTTPEKGSSFSKDISFETKYDAQMVLNRMIDILDEYGSISVWDLYELAGVDNSNYVNLKYGWKNLSYASVVDRKNGYGLYLPHPIPLY